jgi:hypothetical protein
MKVISICPDFLIILKNPPIKSPLKQTNQTLGHKEIKKKKKSLIIHLKESLLNKTQITLEFLDKKILLKKLIICFKKKSMPPLILTSLRHASLPLNIPIKNETKEN